MVRDMNIVERALVGSFESYGLAEGFDYKLIDGVAVFRSFIDMSAFNYAYSRGDVDDINSVIEYFGELPFTWFVRGPFSQSRFKEFGFDVYGTWKGMTMSLLRDVPESGSRVVIGDEERLDHWVDVETRGFGLPEESVRVFARPLINLKMQRFLVAYIGDEPVSAGLVSLCGDVAYLAYVTTVADKRCLGAGRALLSYALKDAREHGCVTAALNATGEGESVYRKLGFEEDDEDYIVLRKN